MSEENQNKEEKLIHEDSDWKEQARREKEKLESELSEPAAHEPPDANFINHVSQLAAQAFIFLGVMANPITGEATPDLAQAKFIIDTIEMLGEKTKGNLNDEEQKALSSVLYELRMKYVSASSGAAPE